MKKKQAEQFEEALQRAARGDQNDEELAELLNIAQWASALDEPVPEAPHRLRPGRQKFLTEAVRLRTERQKGRKERVGIMGIRKLAVALVAVLLLFGLVFGVGQAAADSLPGDPLYGVKVSVGQARLALTSDPQARAAVSRTLAETRMDEVEALLAQQKPVDEATAERVRVQLTTALEAAVQEQNGIAAGALEQLATAVQQRQRTMETMAGETPQQPVRQILRVMERVRQEAHAGAGDPAGLRQRIRQGTPAVPAVLPDPNRTPAQGEPPSSEQPGPMGPKATDSPGLGPQPTMEPGGGPGPGPQPTMEPGGGPGPGPQPTMEPGAGPGPGPQPTMEPGGGPGPQPTAEPGAGPGPGPQPTMEPGAGPGPGPQPTMEPGGGPGPGPQPTMEPGGGPGPGPQPGSGQGGATSG